MRKHTLHPQFNKCHAFGSATGMAHFCGEAEASPRHTVRSNVGKRLKEIHKEQWKRTCSADLA